MFLQASRFIRFLSPNVPAGKVQFDLLSKHIKHEEGIAVFIFHLFGGFTIDGTDDRGLGDEKVDELGEDFLEVGERKGFEESGKGEVDGSAPFSLSPPKLEEGAQIFQLVF